MSNLEHDKQRLFAYLDGAAAGINESYKIVVDALQDLRQEIEEKFGGCEICEYYEDYDFEENDRSEYRSVGSVEEILNIIDRYIKENSE